ncbi:MAG: Dps family protein [Cyanobacteria bacterium J06621_8]
MPKLNIGLTEAQRHGVVKLLNQQLADFYLLTIKTKKYHWDVVGFHFRTLHQLWEEQYNDLTSNIDATAERVRSLGEHPLGTAAQFIEHSTIQEHPHDLPSAKEMVARLVKDHEQIIRNLRNDIDKCSAEYHDEGTADFFTALMEQHEEMAWMLRSFIEGESDQSNASSWETRQTAKVNS